MRGTLTEFPAEQRAILHALEMAREDISQWCEPLVSEDMHARPYGLAPVAFQLRHIVGSLDRLLTYAEGKSLSAAQLQTLAAEMRPEGSKEEILAEFESGCAMRSDGFAPLILRPGQSLARWAAESCRPQ